ncbi:hypothetical protein AAON49_02510 [Pseudotenacibaculum sp. MALMAid0570]|uniref:hypothetical protein n=1 Tax=Pseudotenacibaculum sp. MALMAid0570 TaxID=3143938 RepID=UPI0032DEFD89
MNKLWSYIQYGYLVVGIIFLVEGILQWNDDKEKSLFMFGFSIFIILIFFFKRNFRKKIEKRNQQK